MEDYNGIRLTLRIGVDTKNYKIGEVLIDLENGITDLIDKRFKDKIVLLGGNGEYYHIKTVKSN